MEASTLSSQPETGASTSKSIGWYWLGFLLVFLLGVFFFWFAFSKYNQSFGNPFDFSLLTVVNSENISAEVRAVKAEWGQFGDFIGGFLNPIFAFFNFVMLCITILLQNRQLAQNSEELNLSRNALLRAEAIQIKTEEALNTQINVAVYSRDISNSITLYENLEQRISKIYEMYPAMQNPSVLSSNVESAEKNGFVGADDYEGTLKAKKALELADSIERKNEIRHVLEHEHGRLVEKYQYLKQKE